MKFEFTRALVPAAALLVVLAGCRSRNQPPPPTERPADAPPAEYGQGGEDIPMPPEGERGGRFGYTGSGNDQTPEPSRSGGRRDVREMSPDRQESSGGGGQSSSSSSSPSSSSGGGRPSASQMPFANPVPGNPLVVTLPGEHASLGKISIEKYDSSGNPTGEPLSRGTQVQIPDPNNPGEKIYFKVP